MKPLYSLAKVGNHWFTIYLDHHKEKLGIKMSPYDACLIITKDGGKIFDIVRLQMDNTLNDGIKAFMKKTRLEIMEAKLKAKTRTILKTGASGDWNNYCMIIEAESILIVQNNKAEM